MALPTENAEHVVFIRVGFGQLASRTDADHLCTTILVVSLEPGDVLEIFGMRRIGDIDDRCAVELRLTSQRIHRLWHVGRAAVMTDIRDVALALTRDGWLICAAPL